MRRVLKAKLLDIEEMETAAKRGGGSRPLRLDDPLDGSDGPDDESLTLSDVVAESDPEVAVEALTERWFLKERLDQLIRSLPSDQRDVVRALYKDWSVTEAGRALGIPRPTIYDTLRRLRRRFQDEGLEEFLR
jgi:RNA polymerase sigma factor (sigma-70 family)